MRAITAFLVVAAICQLSHAHSSSKSIVGPRSIGDKFKQMLENLKELLRNGNETVGIPVIDPLDMKRLEFNVQNAVITMKGQVVDLFVTGLSDYFVQNADFKFIGKKVIVDFLWTAINFNTEYNLFDGSMLCKFPIYGAGNLKLKVSQFHFATEANIKMDMKADRLSVLALNNTNIDLENLEVSITGLFGDDELSTLISAVISENAVSMLRDFQGDVTALVNQQIYEVANNYLKNMSLKQLLEKMKQNNI